MKKFILTIASIITLIGFAACSNEDKNNIEVLAINPPHVELSVGETFPLQLISVPESSIIDQAEWMSSDNTIATVDKGVISAISAGEVTITATCEGKTATCSVTINEIIVEKVSIKPDKLAIKKGETAKLDLEIIPSEASILNVSWKSLDKRIATVDNEGNVKAIKGGSTTIEASVGGKKAECTLTVEEILLNHYEENLTFIGDTLIMRATIITDDPDKYPSIEWSSSDENIAKIDADGWVSTFSHGEVTITATSGELNATCHITIDDFTIDDGIGDFFYSDGTTSSELKPDQNPIGIVFWLGDPTEKDPTLKTEHPECTHGLVIAITEEPERLPYMDEVPYDNFIATGYSSFSRWIEDNLELSYESIYEDVGPYKNMGYNNTKALEAFNAAPENSEWQLLPISSLIEYRKQIPAPSGTSDWYLPSLNELSLLTSGLNMDDAIALKLPYGTQINKITKYINQKLQMIEGSDKIADDNTSTASLYWSSSEIYHDFSGGRIMARLRTSSGIDLGNDIACQPNRVRYILAF